jgi:hypothetical protein
MTFISKHLLLAIISVSLLGMTSCSNRDHTAQNMFYGTALGAGLGAATAAAYGGCVGCGAAIGATAGLATGYVVDQSRYGRY